MALQLSVFRAIAGFTVLLERRLGVSKEEPPAEGPSRLRRLLSGPWPLFAGAVGLARVNACL